MDRTTRATVILGLAIGAGGTIASMIWPEIRLLVGLPGLLLCIMMGLWSLGEWACPKFMDRCIGGKRLLPSLLIAFGVFCLAWGSVWYAFEGPSGEEPVASERRGDSIGLPYLVKLKPGSLNMRYSPSRGNRSGERWTQILVTEVYIENKLSDQPITLTYNAKVRSADGDIFSPIATRFEHYDLLFDVGPIDGLPILTSPIKLNPKQSIFGTLSFAVGPHINFPISAQSMKMSGMTISFLELSSEKAYTLEVLGGVDKIYIVGPAE